MTIFWYKVKFDDAGINIDVNPPGDEGWKASIPWKDIIRVCFKCAGMMTSDEIYIFTDKRPESYLIPIEAVGGQDLWNELIGRSIFDAELAIKAAMGREGELFCWPPPDEK